jgi:hypothetical protein
VLTRLASGEPLIQIRRRWRLARQTGFAQTVQEVLGILETFEGRKPRAFADRPLMIDPQDLGSDGASADEYCRSR